MPLNLLRTYPVKIASVALLATVIGLVSACGNNVPYEGDFYQDAQQKGYANLSVVYVPADGFAYTDEEGNLTGVTIDILNEFADFVQASQGIELRYTFHADDSFTSFYSDVKNASGGVFGLGNVTITEDRKKELRFSPPYLTNVAVLITNDSVDQITELSEMAVKFAGMNALAFQGTLHQDRLERLRDHYIPEAELEFATSNAQIIEMVSSREDLFAYIDIYNYWRAAEQGANLRQHPAADLASERFGIIMPLNNDWGPMLTDFFDQGMGFRTSRTYRDILERHLGSELTEKLEAARESAIGD